MALPPSLVAGAATPYVGRDEILRRLREAWAAVLEGPACRTVLLAGEPGVGKTRTAAELARHAHLDGAIVLHGRCDEGMAVPFQPFVETLELYTATHPAPVLGRLPGELVRLLPELSQRVPDLPAAVVSDPRTEEYRLFEAVASFLAAASEQSGMVVVLDDLHWATRATLQLLVHLLKTSAASKSARLLVVGTYRDTELEPGHLLPSVLADLRRLPAVERFDLGGLSADEVVALVEAAAGHVLDAAGRRLAEAAYAETAGNPFFVGELLRHFVETGQVHLIDGRWEVSDPDRVALPESVRDVVGRRLGRLSEAANAVLVVASVVGREFDLELVGSVVDLDESAVLDALDEACRARLVQEIAPDRLRFSHAGVRDTIYEQMSATRRRRLHGQVADVLEKLRPNDTAALARHALEAAPTGPAVRRAVSYLLAAAGNALDARALSEAEALYRQVLELTDQSDDDHRVARVEALCGLGEAQRDQSDASFRATLLEAGRSGLALGRIDLAIRAAVGNFRGVQSIFNSVDRERVELLSATLDAAGPERSAGVALLQATLAAELTFDRGVSSDNRLDLADRAVAMARELGDVRVVAEVLLRSGQAVLVPERWEAAPSRQREVISLADEAGDPTLRALSRLWAGCSYLGVGDVAEARRLIGAGTSIAENDCPQHITAIATAFEVQFVAYGGDLPGAEAANDKARELGEQLGMPDAEQWWAAIFAGFEFLRGHENDLADLVVVYADQYPEAAVWRCAHAHHLAEAGRLDEAREVIRTYRLDQPEAFPHDQFRLIAWTNLALALMSLKDAELGAALETVLRPYEHLWSHYVGFTLGPVRWQMAALKVAQGLYDEAIEHFDAADTVLREQGMPLFRLVLHRDLARTLLASRVRAHHLRAEKVAKDGVEEASRRDLHGLVRQFADVLRALSAT